jgi:hypothetical protein
VIKPKHVRDDGEWVLKNENLCADNLGRVTISASGDCFLRRRPLLAPQLTVFNAFGQLHEEHCPKHRRRPVTITKNNSPEKRSKINKISYRWNT